MTEKSIQNNVYLDGVLKEYEVTEIFEYNTSKAFIVNTHDFWVYFLCDNIDDFINLFEITSKKYTHFAALENWMKIIIEEKSLTDWMLESYEYVCDMENMTYKKSSLAEKLEENDAYFIYDSLENKEEYTVDYLKERIKKDVSAGIKFNGELAAWGLTHDDKTIGFLYVLDKYRNKGYATDILKTLISQKEEMGEKTYLNVFKKNDKSNNLMRKLEFKYTKDIYWIKIK